MRFLLAEDDVLVARGLIEAFERAGYSVDHVSSGDAVEPALLNTSYDLAVLDLGLPVMDGKDVIRRVRSARSEIPILVISARDHLGDRVSTLDLGADDYLVKPFQLSEVMAHVRALLRRAQTIKSAVIGVGDLQVDLARNMVALHGQTLPLTRREWDIFQMLLMARPKVVSKKKLMESLGTWDNEITLNAIEIYVSRLRSKLQECSVEIITVRGLGYRIEAKDG
jgi:two-component system, OmpR family, response regulator